MKECEVVTILISCHELDQAQEKPFTTQGETEKEHNITEMTHGICFQVTEGRTKQKKARIKTWFNVFFHSE